MWIRRTLAIVFATALLVPTAASAAQPPAKIPVQGYLSKKSGGPVDKEVSMTLEVFTAEQMGEGMKLYGEMGKTVRVRNGAFTTFLEPDDLSMFRDNSDLWLQITVAGETIQPRLPLATVPYAANATYATNAKSAESATTADTAAKAEGLTDSASNNYQANISENSCSSGEHAVGLNGDGTVKCKSIGALSAGHGLSKNNGTISVDYSGVSGLTCSGDDKVTGLNADGTPICGNDKYAAQVSAGTGLSKSSGTINLDISGTTSCGSNEQVIGLNADGTVNCGADADGVESVSAGTGLSVSGTDNPTVSLSNVTSSEIQDGTISSADIDSGAVTGSEIDSTSTITASDFQYNSPKTRSRTYPAAAFSLARNNEQDVWELDFTNHMAELTKPNGDGIVKLLAPLRIPPGVELTHLRCWLVDNNNNGKRISGSAVIRESSLGYYSSTDVATVSLNTNGNGHEKKDTSISNYPIDDQKMYTLNVNFDPADSTSYTYHKFRGCEIDYEISSPNPNP